MSYPTLHSFDHPSYIQDTFLIMEQLPSLWAQRQASLPAGTKQKGTEY
jgi:hypothetical protein